MNFRTHVQKKICTFASDLKVKQKKQTYNGYKTLSIVFA